MRIEDGGSPKQNALMLRPGLLLLTAVLGSFDASTGIAGTFTVFGPRVYARSAGQPETLTSRFTVLSPQAAYTLQIINGGGKGESKRVSGIRVILNGTGIVETRDLGNKVFAKPVSLGRENELSVEVRGKPGGEALIQIVGVDDVRPSIQARVEPRPNAAGWNNTAVTVSFTCSDDVSGVASCPGPVVVETEGAAQAVSRTAVDRAGNVATATVSVNIDRTPPSIDPTLSPAANAAGWNNSDVTVVFDCGDTLSGVANCTSPVLHTREGAGQHIGGRTTDRAGNTATASASVSLDKTPPRLDVSQPPDGARLSAATVHLTGSVTDSLSGVEEVTCDDSPATVSAPDFGCELSLVSGVNPTTLQGTDAAGNTISLAMTLVRSESEEPVYPWDDLPAGVAPLAVAVGDVDSDGVTDVLTANRLTDDVSLLLGNGDGTFQSERRFAVGDFPTSLALADANGDGLTDIVTANAGSDDLSVLLGHGDGSFDAQRRFAVGDFPLSVAVGDVNEDGWPDVVAANAAANDLSVLLGRGDGSFGRQQRLAAGDFPTSVAVADLNHDGFSDVVASNAGSDNLSILLGQGDGTFRGETRIDSGQFPVALAIADLNADGALDLVTANVGSDNVSVVLGRGDGAFQAQMLFPTGVQPFSLAVADMDLDGVLDLVVGNAGSQDFSTLLGLGDGTFAPERRLALGDYHVAVGVADLNGDGSPDIVLAKTASSGAAGFDLSGSPIGDATSSSAAVLRVAPWGNDSTGDGSPNNPLRTIQRGVDLAPAGSTINIAPGGYFENVLIRKALTLVGEGGMYGPALVHVGAASRNVNGGAVILVQAPNVTIKGLHVSGGVVGIAAAGLSNGTLQSNLDVSNLNLTIARNVIENNDWTEVLILPPMDGLGPRNNYYRIVNNTLIGNGRTTLGIYANEHRDNATRSQIRNNIMGNHLSEEILELGTEVGSKDIAFNLFYRWPRYVLMYNPRGRTDLSFFTDCVQKQAQPACNNFFPNNLGDPPFDPETDPVFVKPARSDYRIGDGSAARDAGDPNFRNPLWNDPDGTRNDIGAIPWSPPLEWPNSASAANSDPWLATYHDLIRKMRPRVLALNFTSGKTTAQMRAQMQQAIDVLALATRYRGYQNPDAQAFLQYEIAYAVDIGAANLPVESPIEGHWAFDYERLCTQTFTNLYNIEDPSNPGHLLSLCDLIDRGLVHEVWLYLDLAAYTRLNGPVGTVLELKPQYDENRRRRPVPMSRCAGEGCFDEEDDIPCTRAVRILTFDEHQPVGNFVFKWDWGLENIGGYSKPQILPSLSRYFRPFAGFDLDSRYGAPFRNWYDVCPVGVFCLSYPTQSSVVYYSPRTPPLLGVIDPYEAGCGNVGYTPNTRGLFDLQSNYPVRTSCLHFRDGTGQTTVFTGQEFKQYSSMFPDYPYTAWLVWWTQSFPGLDNASRDASGLPMLNWWPYVFY